MNSCKKKIVLETDIGGDIDDFIALNLCLSNPALELLGILVVPGYQDQIDLVQNILDVHEKSSIPIGSIKENIGKGRKGVNKIHFDIVSEFIGDITRFNSSVEGAPLLDDLLRRFPNLTLITIGPLKNFHRWYDLSTRSIFEMYSMGGYFGDPALGQPILMPEYNFGGDLGGFYRLINTNRIKRRVIVSKNVTHSVFYTKRLHRMVSEIIDESVGHKMIYRLMERWWSRNRNRLKKIHDPFTICVAIDENIVELIEVMPFFRGNLFGAIRQDGTGCYITYGDGRYVDFDRFYEIFVQF